MIQVTRLNDSVLVINVEKIQSLQATPDTVSTFTNQDRLMVKEPVEEISQRIVEYQRSVNALGGDDACHDPEIVGSGPEFPISSKFWQKKTEIDAKITLCKRIDHCRVHTVIGGLFPCIYYHCDRMVLPINSIHYLISVRFRTFTPFSRPVAQYLLNHLWS